MFSGSAEKAGAQSTSVRYAGALPANGDSFASL